MGKIRENVGKIFIGLFILINLLIWAPVAYIEYQINSAVKDLIEEVIEAEESYRASEGKYTTDPGKLMAANPDLKQPYDPIRHYNISYDSYEEIVWEIGKATENEYILRAWHIQGELLYIVDQTGEITSQNLK